MNCTNTDIASTRADRRIGPHRNRNCDRVGFAVSNGEHAFMVTLVSVIAKPSQRRLMLICADVGVAISVRPVNIALLPLIAFMYGPVSGFTLSAFQSRKARTLRLARSGIATRHIQSMRIGRYAMALPTLGSAVRPLDRLRGLSHGPTVRAGCVESYARAALHRVQLLHVTRSAERDAAHCGRSAARFAWRSPPSAS